MPDDTIKVTQEDLAKLHAAQRKSSYVQELKKEFTYVPQFDLAHVQLDETINREIKCGLIYHVLTDYGKLEFANMHISFNLNGMLIHPLTGRFVVGINDEMIPSFDPEMPAADFLAYSVTETLMGTKIVDYWFVTALFHENPAIVNQFFDRSKWVAWKMERLTASERLDFIV